MRKRRIPPLLALSTLLGINLLTTNLLFSEPALCDDDKDQVAGYNSVYEGLSGQRASAPGTTTLQSYNGLPETNLDSFVYQAGAMADQIYGDESIQGQPEFSDGFTASHRINAGIVGVNAAGLTTGHGSVMPCAWGADEFLAAPGEWCVSGTGGYDLPPGQSGSAIDQAIGAAVNAVFVEMPNALNSIGTAGANGLGRVMGMPGTAIMQSMPGPAMPAAPNVNGVPLVPGVSSTPAGPPVDGVSPMSSLPSPLQGSPGSPQGLANPIYSASAVASSSFPNIAYNGTDNAQSIGLGGASSGINLSDLSSGVGGW